VPLLPSFPWFHLCSPSVLFILIFPVFLSPSPKTPSTLLPWSRFYGCSREILPHSLRSPRVWLSLPRDLPACLPLAASLFTLSLHLPLLSITALLLHFFSSPPLPLTRCSTQPACPPPPLCRPPLTLRISCQMLSISASLLLKRSSLFAVQQQQ
jgi:hypothetical protein